MAPPTCAARLSRLVSFLPWVLLGCSGSARSFSPAGRAGAPGPLQVARPRTLTSVVRRAAEGSTSPPVSLESPPPAPSAEPAVQSESQTKASPPPEEVLQQRIESLKAAALCAAVGSSVHLVAVGAGALPFLPSPLRELAALPSPGPGSALFGLGAGALQGALFGLTYRYVVRSDRSGAGRAQGALNAGLLGDGAVLAFTLTAAVGQSEPDLTTAAAAFAGQLGQGAGLFGALAATAYPALPFLPRAVGDFVVYSSARVALDRALDGGQIEPFP